MIEEIIIILLEKFKLSFISNSFPDIPDFKKKMLSNEKV